MTFENIFFSNSSAVLMQSISEHYHKQTEGGGGGFGVLVQLQFTCEAEIS